MATATGQLRPSVKAVAPSGIGCIPLPWVFGQEAKVHALEVLKVTLEVRDIALITLITEVVVDLESEARVRVRAVTAVGAVEVHEVVPVGHHIEQLWLLELRRPGLELYRPRHHPTGVGVALSDDALHVGSLLCALNRLPWKRKTEEDIHADAAGLNPVQGLEHLLVRVVRLLVLLPHTLVASIGAYRQVRLWAGECTPELLHKALDANPVYDGLTLVNRLAQEQAETLLNESSDYFE